MSDTQESKQTITKDNIARRLITHQVRRLYMIWKTYKTLFIIFEITASKAVFTLDIIFSLYIPIMVKISTQEKRK